MNQLAQIYSRLSFPCAKCQAQDYSLEIRTETIITLNASATGGQRLDTARTGQARITLRCNDCGEAWSPS